MKIIFTFLLLIVSELTYALECTTEKGGDAYDHLIYLNDGGDGGYSVVFPKILEGRKFSEATLFINSKEMTFINDVKVKQKSDGLMFSFIANSDLPFSAEVMIVWGNNINIQCPVVAKKELIRALAILK
ncbi:MAG: hypothetical protein MJK12_16970 [Colwellia sp.]|nr:hypothetical protein [Colwellia sp.]